jgi:hypothetical protein
MDRHLYRPTFGGGTTNADRFRILDTERERLQEREQKKMQARDTDQE